MLDARGVYRQVTRKVCDFSPEQHRNLLAIVWLHRGQTDRFAGSGVRLPAGRAGPGEGQACFVGRSDDEGRPAGVADPLTTWPRWTAFRGCQVRTVPGVASRPNGPQAPVAVDRVSIGQAQVAFADAGRTAGVRCGAGRREIGTRRTGRSETRSDLVSPNRRRPLADSFRGRAKEARKSLGTRWPRRLVTGSARDECDAKSERRAWDRP